MSHASRIVEIRKATAAGTTSEADVVAVEEPLEIQVCSASATGAAAKSVSITMRTPGHDSELALGFLLTEGIIDTRDDVTRVQAVGEADPATGVRNRIRVELSPEVDIDYARLERHFYTTSSCGVCGKASLDALAVNGCASLSGERTAFRRAILEALPGRIRERQPVFAATGGLHAAAVVSPDGEIIVVREDVGRHNATDKAIGMLLEAGRIPAHGCGLFVSGRASFELVQKSVVAGIPMLAAVGAPSSLAVDAAKEFGMTLVGFLRNGTFNVYAGMERIT